MGIVWEFLMAPLIIEGRFEGNAGTRIAGAAVHAHFLGDPPRGCGTAFDLVRAPAHTNDSGEFRLTFRDPDSMLEQVAPPGAWKRGCFLVLAVADGRTLGFEAFSGDELTAGPVRLVALPRVDVRGTVVDEDGRAVVGAAVDSNHYFLPVRRGPHPHALVNFWLKRSPSEGAGRGIRVTELSAVTGEDGSFVLADVPAMPGGMELTLTHPDHADVTFHYDPLQPLAPLVMQPGAVVQVRITLPNGDPVEGFKWALEGRPDGAPDRCGIRGIPVGMGGFVAQWEQTDEGGHCAFRRLPPGNYTIRCYDGPDPTWAVPVIPVARLARGERRAVEARAVPGTILSGSVTEEESGRPVDFAEIRFTSELYPEDGSNVLAVHTDAQGRFTTRTAIAPRRARPLGVRLGPGPPGRPTPPDHHQPRTPAGVALHASTQ